MAGMEMEDMKSKIDKVKSMQKEIQEPAKDESLLKQLQESLSKLEQDTSALKDQHEKLVEMVKEVPEEFLLYELYKAIVEQEIAGKMALPAGVCDKLGGKIILKKEAEACQLMLEQLKAKLQKTLGKGIQFNS
eukprot:TRINITY_DN1645_c0_g2_i1.p3 TRINITY_DN1645_c0_g2~~TRINITY_DN1645_c0_g2_i1.p3  ORF type:complete len:133 (+),score=48.32 TRINITY_DN1645_c0_g2_i1:1089-1487(+)